MAPCYRPSNGNRPRTAEAARGREGRGTGGDRRVAVWLLDGDRARHLLVHVTPEEVGAGGERRDLVDPGARREDLALEQPVLGRAVRVDRNVVGQGLLVLEGQRERLAGRGRDVLRLELHGVRDD